MVVAHHDVDVVTLLDVRFEAHLQAAHQHASPGGTGESMVLQISV
jgi:hypothetical protein